MASTKSVGTTFGAVIVQILLLDIVFSLDSIITALGMANKLAVMVAAVVIAVGFMMLFSGKISAFVEKHPTIKMLALSFLLLIGVALIGDGFDMHIPKGYIYFAMAFSVMVEMLNLRMRRGTPGHTSPTPSGRNRSGRNRQITPGSISAAKPRILPSRRFVNETTCNEILP